MKVDTVFAEFQTGVAVDAISTPRNNLDTVLPFASAGASVTFAAFPNSTPWISLRVGKRGYEELSVGLKHRF